jgi:hypothetical protein
VCFRSDCIAMASGRATVFRGYSCRIMKPSTPDLEFDVPSDSSVSSNSDVWSIERLNHASSWMTTDSVRVKSSITYGNEYGVKFQGKFQGDHGTSKALARFMTIRH